MNYPITEPIFSTSGPTPEKNVVKSFQTLVPKPFSTTKIREIPYLIGTEYTNGYYNPTFTWESVERILRLIERFKAVKYVRVMKKARLNIIQTNRDLGKGIAAVASKSKGLIRINPTFNFARNLGYCDRVMLHENFHLTGSSKHTDPNDPRPLMHMYGGTLSTILPIDETYISVYPWRGEERFSSTPNLFGGTLGDTSFQKVSCHLEKSFFDRWIYP